MQKAAFHNMKGGLLPCVLRPFAGRKAVFCKPGGGVLFFMQLLFDAFQE